MTISESAFLAGIVPNPTYWDPRQGEVAQQQAEHRWNRTLDLMLENGYITAEDRSSAQFPKLQEYKQGSGDSRTAYLMEQVARELAKPSPGANISEDQLTKNGYEIHTSIDRKMQAAAYETMKLPEDADDSTRASLTSIDPQTGEIKAMYGGPNYSDYPTNAATFRAQGASTFKPFTLIGALREGIPLTKKYDSTDGMTIEGWKTERRRSGRPAEQLRQQVVRVDRPRGRDGAVGQRGVRPAQQGDRAGQDGPGRLRPGHPAA